MRANASQCMPAVCHDMPEKNTLWLAQLNGPNGPTHFVHMQLFAGSISSSGPVNAQTWFPEYFDVAAASLRTLRGQKCLDALDPGRGLQAGVPPPPVRNNHNS